MSFAASVPHASTAPLLDVADVSEFVRSGATFESCRDAWQMLPAGLRPQYQAAAAAAPYVVNPKSYDLYGFDPFTTGNLDRILSNNLLVRLRTHGILWETHSSLKPEELWRRTAEGKPGAVVINADVFDSTEVRIATFPLQWKLFWKHTVPVILTKHASNTSIRIGWYYWGVPVVELPQVDATELVGRIRTQHLLMGADFL